MGGIMSKKYYAIRHGRKPGIYRTWDEAKTECMDIQMQFINHLKL